MKSNGKFQGLLSTVPMQYKTVFDILFQRKYLNVMFLNELLFRNYTIMKQTVNSHSKFF